MHYKTLVKCEKCGTEAWIGFYEHRACCDETMTHTGHEEYDIHGAIWLAGIRKIDLLRREVA